MSNFLEVQSANMNRLTVQKQRLFSSDKRVLHPDKNMYWMRLSRNWNKWSDFYNSTIYIDIVLNTLDLRNTWNQTHILSGPEVGLWDGNKCEKSSNLSSYTNLIQKCLIQKIPYQKDEKESFMSKISLVASD